MTSKLSPMKCLRPLRLFLLLLFTTSIAIAQDVPIVMPDGFAYGKTGVWTDLSPRAQAAVLGEATAAELGVTPQVNISSVEHWSSSFKSNGVTHPYTMLGSMPSGGAVTTIPTVIIPLRFVFDGYLVNGKALTFDPTTQVSLVKVSPLFVAHDYGFGSAQYMDALQRDTFDSTNGYHVKLGTPTVMATHVVHIPASSGAVIRTNSGYAGVVETNYLLNLISHLPHTLGVKTSTLPIMVSHDVYGGSIPPGNSFYYGFHGNSQISSSGGTLTVQLYVWSSWIDAGFFANPKTLDITGFTHEVAEAVNDPFLNNRAPSFLWPYDNVDCNTLLEVGDVIEGLPAVSSEVSVSGHSYHVANVAVLPWFARSAALTTTKSYSFPGKGILSGYSKPCK